jgi:hypothetical protein
MGALIQTKGTQLLAGFFNGRFSKANLPVMRGIGGGSLINDFGFRSSLLDISDAYLGQWTDGSDVLYPTTTVTSGVTGAKTTTTLNFTNPLPNTPQVQVGMAIDDDWPITPPSKAIPNGTTVNAIDATRKIVTISKPLVKDITLGPPIVPIVFSDTNHPNLWKRWRYYLKNDLFAQNHSAIQTAIYEALVDDGPRGYQCVTFQAIEAPTQSVLCATEFGLTGGKIDPTLKFKQIVLLTARTTANAPIDPQT